MILKHALQVGALFCLLGAFELIFIRISIILFPFFSFLTQNLFFSHLILLR
jgi:hypothetical protein